MLDAVFMREPEILVAADVIAIERYGTKKVRIFARVVLPTPPRRIDQSL
jgi:hypothetical protein